MIEQLCGSCIVCVDFMTCKDFYLFLKPFIVYPGANSCRVESSTCSNFEKTHFNGSEKRRIIEFIENFIVTF